MAARNGFRPARTPDTRYVTNYPASAGTRPICIGDAVRYVAGKITAAEAGMDPGAIYGVVLDVLTTANRPFTFQTAKCITSGGVGRADVCWDPEMTYFVKCETSIGTADVPVNVMIDVSAFSTALGISGQAVVAQSSASVGNPFKLLNIAAFERLGGPDSGGAAGQLVEVIINNHLLKAGT